MTIADSLGADALRDMRRRRRRNRVADLEWFEALYRVYLTAIVGGGLVLFLAGLVRDERLDPAGIADVRSQTPHLIGLVVAAMVFLGLRSGTNGGPVAIEEPEVRHVLLSPLPASVVLRHPAIQRLRTATFMGGLAGAITGLMAARRLPHSALEWILAGAVTGALIGSLFITTALLAHGLRLPRWFCTGVGGALVLWQVSVAIEAKATPGPFDSFGSLALWPMRMNTIDVVAVAITVIAAAWGIALAQKLSVEALSRRSSLVSQLKFAVTLQDIRTVVLLRRQLSQEHMRERPWFKLRGKRMHIVTKRGVRSVAHFPARRFGRMAILSAVAGACGVAVFHGTTPAVVVGGLALFVVGLDVIEPLSQEVDQPWRTDALPVERGYLMVRHLVVPAVVMIPFMMIGVLTAFALRPEASTLAMGAIVAVPAALGGVAGAVINAVKGAPDQLGEATEGLFMPPEVSGMTTVIRAVWPPAVSVIGGIPIVVALSATRNNLDPFSQAARASTGVLLLLLLVAGWVRKRDDIRAFFKQLAAGGRAEAQARSSQ